MAVGLYSQPLNAYYLSTTKLFKLIKPTFVKFISHLSISKLTI